MAEHKPLVLRAGKKSQIPTNDTLLADILKVATLSPNGVSLIALASMLGLKVYTNAQEALLSPGDGAIYFNSDRGTIRKYFNSAWGDAGDIISGIFRITGIISPSQITSDQNDYNPAGLATASVLRINADATFRGITGISGGADGRMLTLCNVGTSAIMLYSQDAGSTAANRFIFPDDICLPPDTNIKLLYDGTSSRWRIWSLETLDNVRFRLTHYCCEEFAYLGTIYGFVTQAASGTGAATTAIGGSTTAYTYIGTSENGVISLNTGSTTSGRCAMNSRAGAPFVVGSWYLSYRVRFYLPNLSDATDTYTLRVGLGDSATGDSTNGIYLRYTNGTNSGNWQLVARNASSETVNNTSTAVAASTWYTLEIRIKPAAASAEFFLNGTSLGTVSGLPTGITKLVGYKNSIIKSAGTTSRSLYLDYVQAIGYYPTQR